MIDKNNILSAVLLAVLLLLTGACGGEEGTVPEHIEGMIPLTTGQSNFNDAIITNTGPIVVSNEVNPAMLVSALTDTATPGYVTINKTYDHAPGFNEQLAFDPTSDVIYPGALLKGDSITSGTYTPISGKRGPTTISISLMNLGGSVARTVPETKLSTIRQAISEILAQKVTGATPAYVTFSIEQVHSSDHVKAVLGGNYGGGAAALAGQFDFSNTAQKTKVLVRFLQVYYTIDIDIPVYPCSFFALDADWGAVLGQISNTSPVYVSSVSYGRMAMFSFESAASSVDLKNAIEASFQSAQSGITLDTTNQSIISSASIKATIIGGSGIEAAQAVSGFDALKTYIVNGGNYSSDSPGVPIAYKLRYLKNNALAKIVFPSQYQIENTYEVDNTFRVTQMSVMCIDHNGDNGSKGEYYGYCEVFAYIAPDTSNRIQGKVGGINHNGVVWNIDRDHAEDWELGSWQEKTFASDIEFSVSGHDMDSAYLKVGGWMKEDDGWLLGTDSLGSAYETVKLADLSEYWYYTKFTGDDQEARIWFRVIKLP